MARRSLKSLRPAGALWRHGDFLKLWAGQTVSEFGSQVTLLALPYAAAKLLHASAFAVALLTVFEQLPFLLFALPAGVWIDRVRRAVRDPDRHRKLSRVRGVRAPHSRARRDHSQESGPAAEHTSGPAGGT